MLDNPAGNHGVTQGVDNDQSDAFRYELGTFNRESVLASFDRGDDFARMRFPPATPNQIFGRVGNPANPLVAGWKNFHLTTTDRDLDAEAQDRLHDGQLFRLNRQARGEVIKQPVRKQYDPNSTMFGPPACRSEPALNPSLNNPGEADPLALAKALQFKGSYKGGKARPSVSSPRPLASNNRPFAPSGPSRRGGYAVSGRAGYIPNNTGHNGMTRPGSLNPHSDIHADQGLPTRRKKASVVRGGGSIGHAVQPVGGATTTNRPFSNQRPPAQVNRGRNGIPSRQQFSKNNNGDSANGAHIAPMMDRANSSMSSVSMASSTVGSSSSSAILATNRRHPPATKAGQLASPDEFMAAVKKSGLAGSKYAPKEENKKEEQQKTEATESTEPEMQSAVKNGLSGSKYAG
ncbi:putative negative regulator of dna transposition protein [Lasiodiplodia theobromae]|nr:putative negative regulator of dna transposition protein [Lasiodiplodia theobromae]